MSRAWPRRSASSVKALLAARAGVGDGHTSELQESFAGALVKQIKVLKQLSAEDGSALTALLQDGSYGEEGTSQITEAIESKLASSVGGKKHKPDNYNSQTLEKWWVFQTQADWEFYKKPSKFKASEMCRMVQGANSIWCPCPDEHPIKWMLAGLLLLHYQDIPRPKDICAKLNELKMTMTAEKKQRPPYLDGQEPRVYFGGHHMICLSLCLTMHTRMWTMGLCQMSWQGSLLWPR